MVLRPSIVVYSTALPSGKTEFDDLTVDCVLTRMPSDSWVISVVDEAIAPALRSAQPTPTAFM